MDGLRIGRSGRTLAAIWLSLLAAALGVLLGSVASAFGLTWVSLLYLAPAAFSALTAFAWIARRGWWAGVAPVLVLAVLSIGLSLAGDFVAAFAYGALLLVQALALVVCPRK